jgi:DNA-binding transcriptional ArsR family regulator
VPHPLRSRYARRRAHKSHVPAPTLLALGEFLTLKSTYYLRMRAASQQVHRGLPDDQVDLAVEVFRMLADGTRIRILWALIGRELSVNELAAEVGKNGAGVSQHLAKLRMTRLVQTRREGTQIFYRLENEHVAQLVTDAIHSAEHAGPGVPGHHLADPDLVRLHGNAEGA